MISLLRETFVFFEDVGVAEFLFGKEWSPVIKPQSFGVLPLVSGTFLVTGIALLVAVPLGLGSAIYLSEYASPRMRKTLKPVLELTAGVPTIVFGYFALTFFTPTILIDIAERWTWACSTRSRPRSSWASWWCPTIASVSEDAMSAVPASLREGSYGLGATKLQTSTRVVFPAALSGIVAAIVLGASRAVGETMIVLVAAGQVAALTADPREPMYTMTSYIGAVAKGDIATGQRPVQDRVRRRDAAVPDHAGHEHDLDPVRAQVQAGLRMSSVSGARRAGTDGAPRSRARPSGCCLLGLPRTFDRSCSARC